MIIKFAPIFLAFSAFSCASNEAPKPKFDQDVPESSEIVQEVDEDAHQDDQAKKELEAPTGPKLVFFSRFDQVLVYKAPKVTALVTRKIDAGSVVIGQQVGPWVRLSPNEWIAGPDLTRRPVPLSRQKTKWKDHNHTAAAAPAEIRDVKKVPKPTKNPANPRKSRVWVEQPADSVF